MSDIFLSMCQLSGVNQFTLDANIRSASWRFKQESDYTDILRMDLQEMPKTVLTSFAEKKKCVGPS